MADSPMSSGGDVREAEQVLRSGGGEEHGRRSTELDLNQAIPKEDEGEQGGFGSPAKGRQWLQESEQQQEEYQQQQALEDDQRSPSPQRRSPFPVAEISPPSPQRMSLSPGIRKSLSPVSPASPERRQTEHRLSVSPALRRSLSPVSPDGRLTDGRSFSPAVRKSLSPVSPDWRQTLRRSVSPALRKSLSPVSPDRRQTDRRPVSPALRRSLSPVLPDREQPEFIAKQGTLSPREVDLERKASLDLERKASPSPRWGRSRSPRRRPSPPTESGRRRRERELSMSPRDTGRRRRERSHSRSPAGRSGWVTSGRSRSRSPPPSSSRGSPRSRYSPRGRYSPRRRSSPPSHRSQRRSRSRHPWSPPANRSTGVGKPGNNLFIAGFSFVTTERDLEKKFSRYGRVTDCRIVRDRRSGDSRGFGFLSLERDEDADAAIRGLDQTEWNGRIVLVEKAKSPTRY